LTLGRKRPTSTELNRDAKRIQTVDELPIVSPSSATQKKVHEQFGETVDYNRPEAKRETIPIALLHEIFAVFLKDCQEHVPTHADNWCLVNLHTAMLKEYIDEKARAVAFIDVFKKHDVKLVPSKVGQYLTDGVVSTDGHVYLLSQCKNEWNNLSSDPALQAFMYYVKSLKDGRYGRRCTRLPCLIIYYVGERIHANLNRTPWLTV
jgi:hypothetical protein